MTQLALALLTYISSFLRSRQDLGLEILALRQQVAVLKRKHVGRAEDPRRIIETGLQDIRAHRIAVLGSSFPEDQR